MLLEENEVPVPYPQSYQQAPSTYTSVLDRTPVAQGPGLYDPSSPARPPSGPGVPPQAPPKKRPRRVKAILLLVLLIIFGMGLFAGWEFAVASKSDVSTTSQVSTSSSSTALEAQQEAAIAKVEPAVVEIEVRTTQGEQIGSGVIIDASGDIVTNNHVVNSEESITVVLYNGNTEQAQLIGTNAGDDLAVVRIQPFAHMTVAQFGDSSKLVVGQEVLAIGNPLGMAETVTQGIVSALNRSATESTGASFSDLIQTDVALNPGNSGGALINLQGQLVGIPTLSAVNSETNTSAEGINFAIPSNLVKTVVQQIIQQ